MQSQLLKENTIERLPNIKTAFILSGGKGERLKPLTDSKPKTLLEVKGKPVIEWNILNVINYGVKRIVLGLGFKANDIINFVEESKLAKRLNIEIEYSIEKKPLGTAGALKKAENLIKEKDFIMCNGDEVKDINYNLLYSVHKANNAIATLALVKVKDIANFGSVKIANDKILEFIEKTKKQLSNEKLVSAGAYILSKKIFSFIPKEKNVSIEKKVFPLLAKKSMLFGAINEGQWYPIDTLECLEKARKKWLGFLKWKEFKLYFFQTL